MIQVVYLKRYWWAVSNHAHANPMWKMPHTRPHVHGRTGTVNSGACITEQADLLSYKYTFSTVVCPPYPHFSLSVEFLYRLADVVLSLAAEGLELRTHGVVTLQLPHQRLRHLLHRLTHKPPTARSRASLSPSNKCLDAEDDRSSYEYSQVSL